jgi:glycosyltransferase involved in cell wall biosynthesis
MIRTGAALLKFYFSHPAVALRHTARAVNVLRAGGLGELITTVRRRTSATDEQLARRRHETIVRARLAALPTAQKKNVDILLTALLPPANDLSVLDILHDRNERLRLIHRHILKKYQLLDEEFYSRTYLHGVTSILPADHYMQVGVRNGLRPNPFFDPLEYIASYPDVAEIGMDPVIHYALFGWREGRSAGSQFDGNYYLATNQDVAQEGISPLVHYLKVGRHERRLPRPALAAAWLTDPAKKRGTIIIVSHDAELGGAQQVVRIFANWLLSSTRYDVKLVTMRGGAFANSFAEIAPTFDLSAHPANEVCERLGTFAGTDVKAVFINSVASGAFLKFWNADTPVLAFIHELPKLLNRHRKDLNLIKQRARTIIGGSEAVRLALRDQFGLEEERLRTVYGFIESLAPVQVVSLEEKRIAREELGIDPDAFLVTACGVLHWRKSPDKFIEVAEKVIGQAGRQTEFVWIGGGPDHEQCEKIAAAKGLGEAIRFTGYEPDIMRWLNASDLFVLPSEEDPFPLVCLYAAMALNPIVCFEKAGGMPDFVRKGCGRAVPFGDVEAMASAVLEYAMDGDLRERDGRAGRALVQSEHTVATTGPQLLHYIREAAGLKPHASVVVPNYNYERFLGERLESIKRQTFQDFEVILLDDQSSDGSVSILEAWARERPGTRVIVNKKNSGSPFAQWIRGMRVADSDLVWIAEADDACEPEFLGTLLPYFDNRNVFLGYTKSVPVNENGKVLGDYEQLYLDRIAKGRWSNPYVATDHEEANEGLGVANCIPNASSVVFRRFDPEPIFEESVTKMRMCGDWLFYLRAIRGGLVAYDQHALNLHRRHGATITSKMEGSRRYFDEFATIRAYVSEHYRLGADALAKIDAFMQQDLNRFGIADLAERAAIEQQVSTRSEKRVPSLLFVASDFAPGGGQMFVIRLANAWTRGGGRAVLLNARQFSSHAKVVAKIDPRVAVFSAGDASSSVTDLVERFDIDVVHSALWWADRHVQDEIRGLPDLPWVVTMHGCYETLLDNKLIDPSFESRIAGLLERVNAWVPTAEKNHRVFQIHGKPRRAQQILNGVGIELPKQLTRSRLGLRQDSTILCLATRAIEEKGWLEAVHVTEQLNRSGAHVDLMLIGEGPAAEKVRRLSPKNVHLFGHVENLHDYLAAVDIGLLPSFFGGESMPLILLEMMAMGKPVVATDVGEIANMIGHGDEAGGIVVPLAQGRPDVEGFVRAIRLLLDRDLRKALGCNALRRVQAEYTIEGMVASYRELYRDLLVGQLHQASEAA